MNDDLIENENEFSKIMEWAAQPKVTRRKKHILGQMMVQVKAESSAMQLCQGQHMKNNKNKLKIMSKGTKMEHTTKTGFILGPNVRLSNKNVCIKEMNKKMKLEEGIVEIKKNSFMKKMQDPRFYQFILCHPIQRK